MNSLKLISSTDADGNLRVPLNLPNRRVEVLVVWEEAQPANQTAPAEGRAVPADGRGWPPGFFDRFAGAFAGDPIERGDQGVAEEREPFR